MEKGWESLRADEIKKLTDRELMEALYRAIYGEKPVHSGIATRVQRLERGYWALAVFVVGVEALIRIIPAVT